MHNPVRVELIPRAVPVDDAVRRNREDAVDRLSQLGMVDDPQSGEVNTTARRWTARIGGVEFGVVDFAVQHDDGQAVLSLVFPVDALSIGDLSEGGAAPQVRVAVPGGTVKPAPWGTGDKPDPRTSIPGWTAEVPA